MIVEICEHAEDLNQPTLLIECQRVKYKKVENLDKDKFNKFTDNHEFMGVSALKVVNAINEGTDFGNFLELNLVDMKGEKKNILLTMASINILTDSGSKIKLNL